MPVQQINVKNSSDIESWEWGGGCGREAVRAGSGSSRTSCSNSSGDICRICHCESEVHNPLLAPCYCSGKPPFTLILHRSIPFPSHIFNTVATYFVFRNSLCHFTALDLTLILDNPYTNGKVHKYL